jgi:hypothetical protein
MIRVRGDDEGSVIPLVLGMVLLAALVTFAVVVTSAAFVAQRDLQSFCDGAAIAAAQPGPDEVFAGQSLGYLPIDRSAAQARVDAYAAGGDLPRGYQWARVTESGDHVTIACHAHVVLPLGTAFGLAGGVDRDAISSARAPTG